METPQSIVRDEPNTPHATHYLKRWSVLYITLGCIVVSSFAGSGKESAGDVSGISPQSNPMSNAGDLSARCIDCHDFDPIFSHPVGVTPPATMSVPTDMPLINGKMSCLTCHAETPIEHVTNGETLGFGTPELGMCVQCHGTTGRFERQDFHSRATEFAHLPQSNRARFESSESIDALPDWLDSESDGCMTCHDGALASGSGTVSEMNGRGKYFEMMSSEHPIGLYELSDPYDSDGGLRSASMLDDRIRLFNNHVGCGSCHSVYSPKDDLLVISNEQSALCLGCHEY